MDINADTIITGIIGDPVSHSLSPLMHNTAFNYLKLNYVYTAFHVKPEALKDAVLGMKSLKIKGLNVTVPHKVEVMQYIDEISKEAELIGAVNTILLEDGKLKGFNTDGQGFVMSMNEDCLNKNILILGAGGSARAIAFRLAMNKPEKIFISNRTKIKAENLAEEINLKLNLSNVSMAELNKNLLDKVDIIINTTSVGLKDDNISLINKDWLSKKHYCIDIIYGKETMFLKDSQEKGCRTLSGAGMLLYQGALAFKIWTGIDAPIEIMRKKL